MSFKAGCTYNHKQSAVGWLHQTRLEKHTQQTLGHKSKLKQTQVLDNSARCPHTYSAHLHAIASGCGSSPHAFSCSNAHASSCVNAMSVEQAEMSRDAVSYSRCSRRSATRYREEPRLGGCRKAPEGWRVYLQGNARDEQAHNILGKKWKAFLLRGYP